MKNKSNYTKNKFQKQQHGFSIPENYFNSVDDQLFAIIAEDKLPKKNGFTVPNNYFNSVDESIFSKINFPKKETKVVSLRSRLLTYIPTAAAASILLFFGLNYFTLTDTFTFDNISSDDVENWIDEDYINFNLINFSSQFTDEDFKENSILEDDTTLSDDDILEYFNTLNNTTILTESEIEL